MMRAADYLREAETLVKREEFDAAEALLSEAASSFPDEVWVLHYHADVATRRKDWSEALRRWDSLREKFPSHSSAYSGGGSTLTAAGRFEEAERLLSLGLEQFPDDRWILHHYADLAAKRADTNEAVKRWNAVLQIYPDHKAATEALAFYHEDQPDIDRYARMQRQFYNRTERSVEGIVGNYPYHENFPYETLLLYKFGDVRRPIFEDFQNRIAFDVACGEGRMIRRMGRVFSRCDGADISSHMVSAARQRCVGSNVWVTSGTDCGEAPSSTYDFVFCTISLQHICVYETRNKINQDIVRILKPDGKMTLQMLFSSHFPYVYRYSDRTAHKLSCHYLNEGRHALYTENKSSVMSTNSGCDVVIGSEQLSVVKSDFERHFRNVEFWFHDISLGRPPMSSMPLPENHPNAHPGDLYWGTHYVFIHGWNPRK